MLIQLIFGVLNKLKSMDSIYLLINSKDRLIFLDIGDFDHIFIYTCAEDQKSSERGCSLLVKLIC